MFKIFRKKKKIKCCKGYRIWSHYFHTKDCLVWKYISEFSIQRHKKNKQIIKKLFKNLKDYLTPSQIVKKTKINLLEVLEILEEFEKKGIVEDWQNKTKRKVPHATAKLSP